MLKFMVYTGLLAYQLRITSTIIKIVLLKNDKSTSDSLRLNSTTVLDDTTDSGKPLKQLTHLLKKSFADSWVRQNGCIMYSHFLREW